MSDRPYEDVRSFEQRLTRAADDSATFEAIWEEFLATGTKPGEDGYEEVATAYTQMRPAATVARTAN